MVKESLLAGALAMEIDGGIALTPIDRQTECAPQVFEDLLVLGGQTVAQLDEFRLLIESGGSDGSFGGVKSGSKGRVGSQRTP